MACQIEAFPGPHKWHPEAILVLLWYCFESTVEFLYFNYFHELKCNHFSITSRGQICVDWNKAGENEELARDSEPQPSELNSWKHGNSVEQSIMSWAESLVKFVEQAGARSNICNYFADTEIPHKGFHKAGLKELTSLLDKKRCICITVYSDLWIRQGLGLIHTV